jgi:hypothetical protein
MSKPGIKSESKKPAPVNKCDNIYNPNCPENKELLKMETENWDDLGSNPNANPYLYPDINDPNFNIKISHKKEFSDAKYDGTIAPIAQRADELSNADYELQPQQAFVKNFMSFQTPYNSLLLFHGLGSGKTCSAIGVCEEMRDYLKQMGISKRIIIVASPNVQDNFRLQLFDERKLTNVDGLWTMKGCLGNKLLKEINPTGMKGLTRDKVIQQVKNIINTSYYFVGYLQFSNDIDRHWKEGDTETNQIRNLQNEYSDRLIVIDEVHNIRISDDNENKNVAKNLMFLINKVDNLRLLLLSATPMFNSYKEIVWLLNLMNMNDRRGIVNVSEIFDVKTGNITKEGRELLIKKANGYVSYVRGENPYTFPFRVYPDQFARNNTFTNINQYPEYQLNGRPISKKNKIQKLGVFLAPLLKNSVQEMGYNYIIDRLRSREERMKPTKTGQQRTIPSFMSLKSFGYTDLQIPIEALNIIYPHDDLLALATQIQPFEPIIAPSEEKEEEELEETDIAEAENMSPQGSEPNSQDDIGNIEDVITNGPVHSEEIPSHLLDEGSVVEDKEEEKEKEKEEPMPVVVVKEPTPVVVVKKPKQVKPTNNSNIGLHNIEGDTVSNVQTVKNTLPSSESQLSTDSKNGGLKLVLKAGAKGDKQIEAQPKAGVESETETNLINPRELTGTDGLKRVMMYDDSITPAVKGNFQYRKGIEPIFSQKNIIKYSSKIANVCNYIYGDTKQEEKGEELREEELGEVGTEGKGKKIFSDGIILIYSSYIDGGLIPMALALEEMGFTRFGKNAKPLFKTAPTAIVDVSKSKKIFKPARYAMITGDKRLSPNNDDDIKKITSDNNIYGEEVKVILLSQAGSEGLDFKAIRQIHILDPWYNVSRIEQIIGRGVRNFSHKDLPFEDRNVQIFLYGTLLSNRKEEAADLYIYRNSEIKAIKIGKVTRILKQISVDCHINHDQTQLTTDNFKDKLGDNSKVVQILSNHTTINEFLVGDVDNSATCDYQSCEIQCEPAKTSEIIDDTKDNKFKLNATYNETFMLVNSDKIIQRIRRLFSDKQDGRFFYLKKTLLYLIKQERSYPTVQIYAALTQMITDNSEFITDKYGRTGHLVNIGEYYMFQPNELNYPHISIYNRSKPLDYKRSMVQFELNTDILKPVIDKRNINKTGLEEGKEDYPGLHVIDAMFANYVLALKKTKVSKGENNWYEHFYTIIKAMSSETIIPGIDDNDRYNLLRDLLIEHIVDELMMTDRINLMNYLYKFEELEDHIPDVIFQKTKNNKVLKFQNDVEITYLFKQFIDVIRIYLFSNGKILKTNKGVKLSGIVIFDGPSSLFNEDNGIVGASNGNLNLFILKGKTWVPAEPEDKRDFESVIKKKYKLTKKLKERFNKYVGFIGFENNRKYMTFKLKDTSDEKNTAYRCEQSGKDNIIDMLVEIEAEKGGKPRWFKRIKKKEGMTEAQYKDENKFKTMDGAFELCIREEFTLRSFQKQEDKLVREKKIDIPTKIWFLDTETAIYNQFEQKEKTKKGKKKQAKEDSDDE